ncbi:Raffinose synthase [Penicillium chermesinum]|nr:Raffinose synthase [Penicillium chermesinum]
MAEHIAKDASTLPITGAAERLKPSQATFIRPAQMSLFARVTSYPPLGQVTCIKRLPGRSTGDVVRFTVVIESSTSLPQQSWEAQIWHNITSPEWSALPLQRVESTNAPLLSGDEKQYNFYRYVFAQKIPLPTRGGHAKFTVRFRTNPNTEWQWANQQHPLSDGELIFSSRESDIAKSLASKPSPSSARDDLARYIDHLSPDVKIESRHSESPGSLLWRLTEDAIMCSFLRDDGINLVLLAVSGVNDVLTVFQSGENGEVVVQSRSDNHEASNFHVLISAAEDFEVGLAALVYESRKLVNPVFPNSVETVENDRPLSPEGDDVVLVEKDVKAQWLAEWYDGLTYCTWNGLGQSLTQDKILEALDALKSNGIKITNLIIDDNWQSLDNEGQSQFRRRWMQFDANPKAFPRGLEQAIWKIRQFHPNVGHIAVWHALLGYWGGISPDGELAKKYKTKEVRVKDPAAGGPIAHNVPEGKILAIHPDDIQQFYNDFYGFLRSAGVDAVKADAQFFIDLLDDPEDRKSYITSFQDAWSIAALRNFGTKTISCMSLIPQMIFHSQLPTNKPSIILRNSDDYFPEINDSHPWHLFCNAHNSLFTRYLNALPDWDMFQTSHPYASFHGAARCISGGPVYITDEPGKHDLKLLEEMLAPTVQGGTIILRPSVVGRTIDVYHDYNERNILRVGSYTGWAKTGSGILGLFNLQSGQSSSIVSLRDFPGIHADSTGSYVIRAHTSGKVTGLLHPLEQDSLVSVLLEERGWEILTAYPTRPFTLKHKRKESLSDAQEDSESTHVAVLGLLGKMTGAAATVSSDIHKTDTGRLQFNIHLKALGVLGIYFSDLAKWDISENFMVTILGRAIPQKTVWKQGGDGSSVLAIDVLTAWKEMKLDSGWSNEVVVQVFVG